MTSTNKIQVLPAVQVSLADQGGAETLGGVELTDVFVFDKSKGVARRVDIGTNTTLTDSMLTGGGFIEVNGRKFFSEYSKVPKSFSDNLSARVPLWSASQHDFDGSLVYYTGSGTNADRNNRYFFFDFLIPYEVTSPVKIVGAVSSCGIGSTVSLFSTPKLGVLRANGGVKFKSLSTGVPYNQRDTYIELSLVGLVLNPGDRLFHRIQTKYTGGTSSVAISNQARFNASCNPLVSRGGTAIQLLVEKI